VAAHCLHGCDYVGRVRIKEMHTYTILITCILAVLLIFAYKMFETYGILGLQF